MISIITIVIFQHLIPELTTTLDPNTSSLNTFINNCLGYCLILIPGYWLYSFAKQQDLGGKILVLVSYDGTIVETKCINFKLLLNVKQITVLQVNC